MGKLCTQFQIDICHFFRDIKWKQISSDERIDTDGQMGGWADGQHHDTVCPIGI